MSCGCTPLHRERHDRRLVRAPARRCATPGTAAMRRRRVGEQVRARAPPRRRGRARPGTRAPPPGRPPLRCWACRPRTCAAARRSVASSPATRSAPSRRRPGTGASHRAARRPHRARRCRSARTSCAPTARRSRSPSACTSIGRWAAACAPSTTTDRPARVREVGDGADRVHGADGVRDVRHRHQARARPDEASSVVERAARPASVTGSTRSVAPRLLAHSICQGTRLEWCSSVVTTTSSSGADARAAEGQRHQVDRLGGPAHEHHLARRIARVHERARPRRARPRRRPWPARSACAHHGERWRGFRG